MKYIKAADNDGLFNKETFTAIFKQYVNQISKGIGVNPDKITSAHPLYELFNNLVHDAARFTAFREAQKERELTSVKTDLDKSRIEKKYAEFLKTEKQGVFANSAAAERWMGFQENADLYPNLTWRTAGDSDVRPEHARLEGLTLPIDDPFWRKHSTPLGFGCRCDIVQTDEEVNRIEGYDTTSAPKGFDFNPGIDQKIFSDSAGYYTSVSSSDAKKINTWVKEFMAELKKENEQEK